MLKRETLRVKEAKRNLPALSKQIGEWDKEANYKALKKRHFEVIDALRPKKKEEPTK